MNILSLPCIRHLFVRMRVPALETNGLIRTSHIIFDLDSLYTRFADSTLVEKGFHGWVPRASIAEDASPKKQTVPEVGSICREFDCCERTQIAYSSDVPLRIIVAGNLAYTPPPLTMKPLFMHDVRKRNEMQKTCVRNLIRLAPTARVLCDGVRRDWLDLPITTELLDANSEVYQLSREPRSYAALAYTPNSDALEGRFSRLLDFIHHYDGQQQRVVESDGLVSGGMTATKIVAHIFSSNIQRKWVVVTTDSFVLITIMLTWLRYRHNGVMASWPRPPDITIAVPHTGLDEYDLINVKDLCEAETNPVYFALITLLFIVCGYSGHLHITHNIVVQMPALTQDADTTLKKRGTQCGPRDIAQAMNTAHNEPLQPIFKELGQQLQSVRIRNGAVEELSQSSMLLMHQYFQQFWQPGLTYNEFMRCLYLWMYGFNCLTEEWLPVPRELGHVVSFSCGASLWRRAKFSGWKVERAKETLTRDQQMRDDWWLLNDLMFDTAHFSDSSNATTENGYITQLWAWYHLEKL